ncbi:glycosyltransferase family 2 protein [Brachyspira pilosicoli]|uniref:glycosyltransferase family 2 protein n=1 Tax=Brachyspira pilosicoli TaxID=52584 RepID=UPI0025430F06|nr:glycosyltransferase family 2 protein [Brachyspira pilosicoli]WIH80310.1 glycosyltransferase [Brachyspira pilosicoli]WIH84749.1 glycosyltransferase [Brachyspira pilosicoli]
MPKVSVVIPIYNVEKYLKKCLDSVINQTLKDIEIICVNDCSSDNSESIIKEYINKDNRVKLISHKENQGLGFARNSGLLESRGEYISFIDSDDFVSENFIEELYNTAVKYNADIVFTNNIYTVNESTNNIKPYYHNRLNIWKKKFNNSYIEGISNFNVNTEEKENTPEYPLVVAWNKLYKKNFLTEHKLLYSKYRLAEDVDMFYRFLVYNPKMYYNNNAKYYYLQRSTSLAGNVSHTKNMPLAILEVFENIFNYYKENKKELLIDCNYYNFFSLLHTFNNYKAENKDEFYKLCHNLIKKLDVEIDRKKHAFYSYNVYIMKTYDDYNIYIEKIESIKKKVFSVAWWIPSITLREKYKKYALDKIANSKF